MGEYCLRALGDGVVNVEISPEQLEDRIEEAIEYYHEFHFDGVQSDYLSLLVTPSVLTVADATGFSVNDIINNGIVLAKIVSINVNDITIDRMVGGKFAVGNTLSNGTVSTTITTVQLGAIDSHFFETDETVVGITKILNISNVISSSETLFNVNYQIMMSEIRNLTSAGSAYLYGTMSYLGNLDYIMKTEKDFRFNRHMGKLYLDINWETLSVGDYLVAEIYRYVDDTLYKRVLNDVWLKEYTTALIKKQIGTNTKKYSGMTLPGGITYNGQQMFNEAMEEIQKLQDVALNSSAPLNFFTG